MGSDSTRQASRMTTVLILLAAHGLVLWLFWRVEVPLPSAPEAFTSLLYWAPADQVRKPNASQAPRVAAPRRLKPPSITPVTPVDSGTAITLPAVPDAQADWSAALKGAAAAELDREKRSAAQLGALTSRYLLPTDPLNPGLPAANDFRWYDAGIHRIDTRGPIPVLHLNSHCVLLAFIIPACLIGHIDSHGDLFDGAAAFHDEKLATPRPNDAP
ncbi:MAG TPA: hypothetical protein VGV09_20385 [Steroidobacteraceae bacterium]|nr:hypothetical protein [Steroidobacteraceae bacterium]